MALTEKEERYCQAYVVSGNQKTAYRTAYDADAMNDNSVAVEACRLHASPNISLRIREIQFEAYQRNKASIDELVADLSLMARFDIGDLYDDNGNLLPIKEMPLTGRQLINQFDVDEIKFDGVSIGQTKKIRLYNKLDVVEKLMKHLGGYEKDNFQKGVNILLPPQITFVDADE